MVYEYDQFGQQLGQHASVTIDSTSFELVNLVFNTGADASAMRVALVALEDADVCFDDLKLERAGSTLLYFE